MKTTTLPATLATISKVEGEVFIRGADGAMRAAKVGEQLSTLDTLLTKGGANAALMLPNGQSMVVAPEGEYRLVVETSGVPADVAPAEGGGAEVAQVIEALEAGRDLSEELEAAAAGLTGGGADAGHSFVRLTRVSEATTPLAYEFPSEGESELLPFNAPAGAAESAEATEPPPVDLEPVAVDDHGRAAVVVRGQEGDFNGNARVMGAGEGAMSFETRLAIPHNQDVWLISDASFKGDVLGKFEGEFKITDKGEGSDPAFVVTPNFMADAGDTFSFTASTNLNPGDEFKAEVYVKGDGGWSLYDTIAGDGDYSYTFAAEGEYRVQFTVDDNTGGQGQASATIDITSGGFFSTGGGSDVTYEAAEGNIFENDTFGDGDFADHSWSFADGTADAEGVVTVKGVHGTLTIAPDGTYSYQPSAGGTDSFEYTLTDADGDSASATLTIEVDYSLYDSGGNLLLGGGDEYGTPGGDLPPDIVIEGALFGGDAGQSDLDDILENDPGKA